MNKLQSDKVQGSALQIKSLAKYRDVLRLFEELVSSMRGPYGRTSMLQNSNGGNLVLTSSSRLLLSSLSVDKAIIRLIVSACQSHMSMYFDGGLFLMSLSTKLVVEGPEREVNPVLLSDMFEVFLTLILEILNSTTCCFKIKTPMSDLTFMSTFVNSILKSKPLCLLNDENCEHLSRLIIECFLTSVDDINMPSSESVYMQCVEGHDVSESFTKQGILLLAPEFSRFKEKKNIELKLSMEGKGRDNIKVTVVTVSMSGDMDELAGVKYTVSDSVLFDDVVVDGLAEFCDVLISREVGLVLCQKVVHPDLKYRLRQGGVLVVDRIGNQSIGYILSLTGAAPIQSLNSTQNIDIMIGWLSGVSHCIVHGKSYLLLNRDGGHITTLYLCHQQDEHLNEFKDVCHTALVSLHHLLYEPYVLPGAGCWQTLLASSLTKQVEKNVATLCRELGCTEIVLKKTCNLFTKCLIKAGTSKFNKYSISRETGHLFYRDSLEDEDAGNYCCCGLEDRTVTDVYHELGCNSGCELTGGSVLGHLREITKDVLLERVKSREVILDGFAMCKSALQTSVLTAVSALRIGQVIEDTS